MSFIDDFSSCMRKSGLPTPEKIVDSPDRVIELLDRLHAAWVKAGHNEKMTLAALAAIGAITGLDEAILRAAVDITVRHYLDTAAICLARVAGGAIWKAPRTYTVKPGDTLSGIAREVLGNADLWPKIAQANHLSNPNTITVGQVLVIPAT
ncbi:MAG: LysM peptidoglycan-binding domain-containing protein [Pseudonocardia sp.]|nr:LysM peptidoglycan-binding domain-containing protein [Pseudonocardia sp.]